jgi:Protein of unknown function (DUF1706)
MNKVEFLQELIGKRAEWDDMLAQIPREQMIVPGVNDAGWTVKDIIAHVAWYENEAAYILKSHTLDSQSPENSRLWETPINERNTVIFEQNRDLPLDEVLARGQEAYKAFLQEAQKLADEDLNDPTRYKDMPEDWTPWEVVASNTFEHYPDHVAELRTWRAKANS